MADTKISALPASTVPLAGTEVLPIVQSGATKQVSVANLTAGRPVTASDVTVSTGNLVIGTSGKGIDFSATAGTGTSELLADYEEGEWTPLPFDAASGGNQGTVASSFGNYTKVGNLVTLHGVLTTIGTAGMTAGNAFYVGGLPYAAKNTNSVDFHGVSDCRNVTNAGGVIATWIQDNGTRVRFFQTTAAGAITATLVSNVTSGSAAIYLSITYLAA